jgi:hypothetical protein
MRHCMWFILLLVAPLAFAGTAKISGTVVDQNGMPVAHVTIEAFPVGMAWSGGIPQATTDENGHFVVPTLVNGREPDGRLYGNRWAVYPHDEGGYYPRSTPFYTTPKSEAQYVEVTPENPEAIIEVKLGPKAGALTGYVTDSRSGATLHPDFEFAWASGEPDKRMGKRTGDPYRILLPADTDIKLVVQCEGHKPWTYPGVINVGPGQDMKLDIKLDPIAAK